MALSSGHTYNFSWPNSDSIDSVQSSMDFSSMRSTSHSKASTTRTRGVYNFGHVVELHLRNMSSYETISDLMGLQDQIDSFQRMIFAHFRHSASNECRISALVPLVKESWGIYRFITSMLRAMHRRECTSCRYARLDGN